MVFGIFSLPVRSGKWLTADKFFPASMSPAQLAIPLRTPLDGKLAARSAAAACHPAGQGASPDGGLQSGAGEASCSTRPCPRSPCSRAPRIHGDQASERETSSKRRPLRGMRRDPVGSASADRAGLHGVKSSPRRTVAFNVPGNPALTDPFLSNFPGEK